MSDCSRCGEHLSAFVMSYFNTDVICLACKQYETEHPLYEYAKGVETEEVKKGNYNFLGIGLPSDFYDRRSM